MRIHWATPWRFTAQSNAESPPPTSSTRFPVKILGSRMRSCSPFPYQRSTSLSGSLRGVKAPIPPAMSTVRDGFRAHQATVDQVRRLCAEQKMELRTFWEVRAIHGTDAVERVTIVNSKTKEEETVGIDAVLPQLGFISSLGAIAEWGLEVEKGDIRVTQTMATNIPGIFAAGDITTYPGKLKLIATGAAEACIAVNHAVHFINPAAKIEPGHSSNMALFGQKDD